MIKMKYLVICKGIIAEAIVSGEKWYHRKQIKT